MMTAGPNPVILDRGVVDEHRALARCDMSGPTTISGIPEKSENAPDPWRDPRHRRRFRRYEFSGRVMVSKSGSSGSTWGLCSDLGEGGLGATIVGEVAAGETVWLRLTFPNTKDSIDIRAIVRYRELHHCGFEFLTLNESQHQTIRDHCQDAAVK